MKTLTHKTTQAYILLILLGTIWGTGYSIARFAMTNNVSPLGYSFWQAIGPAIIISLISVFSSKLQKNNVSNLKFYVICGLTGIVIPNTIMYFSAVHLPASLLAMVVNIVPIIAYPMALFVKAEKFHWQRLVGILFAVVGLMLLILPKTSLPQTNLVPWVMLTLITPISFAFCSIYIAKCRPSHLSTLHVTAGMLVSASLLLLPLVLATHSFHSLSYPLTLPDKIIILEIILSSIGYLIFFQLIKMAGPVFYSLVDTIVTLTGITWGYLIFSESLNQWTASALFFILLGIIFVTQQQSTVIKEQNL